MAAFDRTPLLTTSRNTNIISAEPGHKKCRITPNLKPLIKLDLVQQIVEADQELQSFRMMQKCGILHALSNRCIISQPQTILQNLRQATYVNLLFTTAQKGHVRTSRLLVAESSTMAASKILTCKLAANYRKTIDDIPVVLHSIGIHKKLYELKLFHFQT